MLPSTRSVIENETNFTEETTQSNYTVDAGGMIFHILSSGLYTNEVAACIKEPISNGQDSHAMAGCPERPVKVHLPTELEPFYSIRDFGVSMTDDMVSKVFGSLGKSTKHLTQGQIGGFGVGGKSPWSYTEIFTITTYLDGVKSVYVNDYNNHKPILTKTLSEPTEEENGVMISFSVKENDISRFRSAYEKIVRFMEVKPEVNAPIEDECEILKNDECGFMVVKNVDPYDVIPHTFNENLSRTFALVGNIPYPLDTSDVHLEKLKEIYKNNPLTCAIAKTRVIVFNFEVDEIDVLPSREFLDYKSEKTLIAIEKAFKKSEAYYKAQVEQTKEECKGKTFKECQEIAWRLIDGCNNSVLSLFEVEMDMVGECKILTLEYTTKASSYLAAFLRKKKLKVNKAFSATNSDGYPYKLFMNSSRTPERNALDYLSIEGGSFRIYFFREESVVDEDLKHFVTINGKHKAISESLIAVHDKETFELIQKLAPNIKIGEYNDISEEDRSWLVSDQNPIIGWSYDESIFEDMKTHYLYNQVHYHGKTGKFSKCEYFDDVKRQDIKAYVNCYETLENVDVLKKEIPKLIKKNGWRRDQVAFIAHREKKLVADSKFLELGALDINLHVKQKVFMKKKGISSLERRSFAILPTHRHVKIVNESSVMKNLLKEKFGGRVVLTSSYEKDSIETVPDDKKHEIGFGSEIFKNIKNMNVLKHTNFDYVTECDFDEFCKTFTSMLGENTNVGE